MSLFSLFFCRIAVFWFVVTLVKSPWGFHSHLSLNRSSRPSLPSKWTCWKLHASAWWSAWRSSHSGKTSFPPSTTSASFWPLGATPRNARRKSSSTPARRPRKWLRTVFSSPPQQSLSVSPQTSPLPDKTFLTNVSTATTSLPAGPSSEDLIEENFAFLL